MRTNCKKYIVLPMVITISLLFSYGAFASPEDDLLKAIRTNNTEEVRNLLEKGVDPRKLNIETLITYESLLPSCEISELLLKNGINPDEFLNMILNESYIKYHQRKGKTEIINKLITQRNNLVKLAFDNKADPKKINIWNLAIYESPFPSHEMGDFILKKGIDSNKFLKQVLKIDSYSYNPITEINDEKVEQINSLIKLAFANKADLQKLNPEDIFPPDLKCPSNKTIKLLFENGLDPNLLLEIAFCQGYYKMKGNAEHFTLMYNKENLMPIALEKGAKFSELKLGSFCSTLPSYESAEIALENGLNPDEFLNWIVKNTSSEEVEQRDNLVELSLDKGADANKLLENVFNQYYYSKDATRCYLALIHNKENLITIALKKGAKFSIIKLAEDGCPFLPSFESAKIALENGLNPNTFVSWIATNGCFFTSNDIQKIDNEQVEQLDRLVKLAVNYGAETGKPLDTPFNHRCYERSNHNSYCSLQ